MDQNNINQSPVEQHQPLVQETELTSPSAPIVNNEQPAAPSSHTNKSLMVVVIILAILTVAVFIFLFLFPQTENSLSTAPSQTGQMSVPLPTSTPALSQEEQEVENVEVGEVESDIKSVEADAGQL